METLFDKTNYICHYEKIKIYLRLGLKVKKLQRIVKFRQLEWLGAYIAKSTTMREQASNDFETFFHKLRSNALFGITMENFR